MTISVEEPIWIIEIKQVLEDKDDEGLDRPPCIFTVPKAMKFIKPDAYTPQVLALGPYHRWREELYEMERFKVLTTKKVMQTRFDAQTFKNMIHNLALHESRTRARYDKYLKMSTVEIAWVMAIDGQFLVQFLYTFGDNESESVLNLSPRLASMINSKGHKKPSYDGLVKDVMMLENQIPISVLKRILEVQCPNVEIGMNLLANLFLDICKKTSPFKIKAEPPIDGCVLKKRGHLLGFYYSLVNRMWDQQVILDHAKATEIEEEDGNEEIKRRCGFLFNCSMGHRSPKKVFEDLWGAISKLSIFKRGPLRVVGVIKDLTSKVIPNFSSNATRGDSQEVEKIIQVEEIVIPSVSSLVKAGIELKPTNGGLFSIKFDGKSQTLYLPVVTLDVNSEVIIRNLVAYETLAISGPLVLARYAELMNGIVDSEEDAKILKAKGIVKSELKNEEVASLWNGMSKSVRLTKVEFIEETIVKVNKEYNSLRTVKLYRITKAYVYASWRMLVILATLLVIGLMCLQSFCSVYNCPRFFHLEGAEQ